MFCPTAESLLQGLFGHGVLNGVSDVYNRYPFCLPSAEPPVEQEAKQKIGPEVTFRKRLLGEGGSAFTGNE